MPTIPFNNVTLLNRSVTSVKPKRVIRDGQKSKVYAAEREVWPEAFSGIPRDMTVAEVQAYVNALLREAWTRRRWGNRRVAVTDGRGRSSAVSMGGEIRIPLWARQPVTILHELAHELCPREEWHGPVFARTMLELVGHKLGADAQKALRAAYSRRRVKVGSPTKLRPADKVPAAPVVVKLKTFRIEIKRRGKPAEVISTEATSITRALDHVFNTVKNRDEVTSIRVWRGVTRKAAVTTRAAARKRS